MSEKKQYSLKQYNTSIQRLLKDQVPKVWVMAEIAQINPRGGMVYITLAQHEEGSARPEATLNTYAYLSDFEKFEKNFNSASDQLTLRKDLKVCVLLEADFYVPYGKIQPRVCDIDPSFSLGEMAKNRAEILKKLKAEGLLEKQKQLSLPDLPIKIGLITAPSSAAHADFTQTLLGSAFAIQIILAEAKMQGQSTSSDILKGISKLEKEEVDLICVIRGGGSKTDLVWFDDENLCRGIANCKTPILTGIGHEIDHSLADEVSCIKGITPTASAEWIIERLSFQYQKVQEINSHLTHLLKASFEEAQRAYTNSSKALGSTVRHLLSLNFQKLKNLQNLVFRNALNETYKQESMLIHYQNALVKESRRQVDKQEEHRKSISQSIIKESKRLLEQSQRRFQINSNGFEKGVSKILNLHTQAISHQKQRLKFSLSEKMTQNQQEIKSMGNQLKAYDPKKNLARGYAIVRSQESGKVVKFDELNQNVTLETQIDGGVVYSKVIETKKGNSK